MVCRGIRGAVYVGGNNPDAILSATRQLLEQVTKANGVSVEDVASVIFTATPDLNAAYPARAAREMGWVNTPMLCVQEMAVPASLAQCVRVLVHWNTDKAADQIRHIYLGDALALRPDLANGD